MKYLCILLTVLLLSSCLKEDPLNLPFQNYLPIAQNDGIELSNPALEHIDPQKLESIYHQAYTHEDFWSLRSLLVFRNGKLLAESYLKDPEDINTRHLIWSTTKQVLGAITGIALEKGVINSLDDPISKYFTEQLDGHPEKSGITIRQLLNMQSGIDFNNDGVSGQTDKLLRQLPDSLVSFILERPMRSEPGTEFYYNDGDPHLLSALIQKAVGKPTDEWAQDVFFSKLGITNLNWVRYKDGVTHGGYGIETTPRELGKIGLCVANQGKYKGQQLIPDNYFKAMISPQIKVSDDYSFGYYWWVNEARNIHFTWGHGGQFAFIIPDFDLVVIMTSIPNTQGNYQILADEALNLVDGIIAACQ